MGKVHIGTSGWQYPHWRNVFYPHDLATSEWPIVKETTAAFIYIRFHGNKTLYTSGYTDIELGQWSKEIKRWMKKGKDIYVYFNNDAAGFAISNALTLKMLIGK